MSPTDLPMRMRAMADAAGLSGAELARRLDCSRQTVNHWFTGRAAPPSDVLAQFARECGAELEMLTPADADALGTLRSLDEYQRSAVSLMAEVLPRMPAVARRALFAQLEEWRTELELEASRDGQDELIGRP
jgi:transcriptional regulator with XRE-family HTH domain